MQIKKSVESPLDKHTVSSQKEGFLKTIDPNTLEKRANESPWNEGAAQP